MRACRVDGFPYRVVYEVLPDAIYIIAVAHASREPGYWTNRLTRRMAKFVTFVHSPSFFGGLLPGINKSNFHPYANECDNTYLS